MSTIDFSPKMRLKANKYASRTAYTRLEKAIEENNNNEIYSSIGELLLWVITTEEWHKKHNDQYKTMKKSDENGKIILGLRHAYNSMKHNMDFFELYNKEGGFTLPFTLPFEIKKITVCWRPAVNLLEEGCQNQIDNYIEHIEGKDVLKTFNMALIFLNKVSYPFIMEQ